MRELIKCYRFLNINGTLKTLIGEAVYNKDEDIWFGKIANIDDLVTYQTDNYDDLLIEFNKAIDDYIEFCKEVGKEIILNNGN